MCKSEHKYTEFIKCLALILDLVLCRRLLHYFSGNQTFFSFPSENENKKRKQETIIAIVKFRPYETDAK